MATVKLTHKPVAEALGDGDQVVLIQGGAIKLLPADKLGNGGAYGFAVDEDGHLILTYEGDIPPNYTINSQGHLILTVGNNQTIDLGQVKGTNFIPSVSADGTLSWSNDGGLPNPEPVNIRGPQGEQGIQGNDGPKGDPGEGVPAVSAADDGAFLRVRDGAWAAVQVPEAEGVGF